VTDSEIDEVTNRRIYELGATEMLNPAINSSIRKFDHS